MPRYRSLTYMNLAGEQIVPGQILPEAFTTDDAGHEHQLAQLVAEKTIVRLPGEAAAARRQP
jgi:hypothetical protein